jgi:hypothetical protein
MEEMGAFYQRISGDECVGWDKMTIIVRNDLPFEKGTDDFGFLQGNSNKFV